MQVFLTKQQMYLCIFAISWPWWCPSLCGLNGANSGVSLFPDYSRVCSIHIHTDTDRIFAALRSHQILACACRDHSGSFLRLVCVWLYTHREWCYQICSMHQFACCCIIPYQCNARPTTCTSMQNHREPLSTIYWVLGLITSWCWSLSLFCFWNDLNPFHWEKLNLHY